MPGMCGAEAIRKIRNLGYEGLIVGVTGNALEEDADEFNASGADAVMVKPFDAAVFQKILEEKLHEI